MLEEAPQQALLLGRRDAEVGVSDHVNGRREGVWDGNGHGHIVSRRRGLYKRRAFPETSKEARYDLHGVTLMGQETVSEIRVRYAETDQMGVVYHANYLVWCEIGRTDFIRRCGMSYADMERAGTKLAVTEATLRLHASARYDDEVRVTTRLAALRSRAVEFAYDITRADDGTRIASATTILVSLSPEGRPVTLTPDIRALLERGPLVT